MSLDFDQLRETNAARCAHWHPGFPHDEEWTLSDWSNAMAGEMGEAANVVKKIRRVETGNPGKHDGARDDLVTKLGEELADVILYADLLAAKAGLDLGEEIRRKFDAVSEREGFPERMAVGPIALSVDGELACASRGDPPGSPCLYCSAAEGEWCEVDCPGKAKASP